MRVLAEMLEPLAAAVTADDARHSNGWASHAKSCEVARRLPVVHRTCKPGSEAKWLEVLTTRRFAAGAPCTGDRERAAGIPRAAYFCLGSGAYPDGLVGFVLELASILARPASYTPLDSGSIEKYVVPVAPARAAVWDERAKDRFLLDHVGAGADVAGFAGPYLAAHFREPLSYVRLGQRAPPDFAAYHGLADPSGDRRAFTIEVQAHDDVHFDATGVSLREIVVARSDLLDDLPDDLLALARLADAENEVLESIANGIATRIEAEIP